MPEQEPTHRSSTDEQDSAQDALSKLIALTAGLDTQQADTLATMFQHSTPASFDVLTTLGVRMSWLVTENKMLRTLDGEGVDTRALVKRLVRAEAIAARRWQRLAGRRPDPNVPVLLHDPQPWNPLNVRECVFKPAGFTISVTRDLWDHDNWFTTRDATPDDLWTPMPVPPDAASIAASFAAMELQGEPCPTCGVPHLPEQCLPRDAGGQWVRLGFIYSASDFEDHDNMGPAYTGRYRVVGIFGDLTVLLDLNQDKPSYHTTRADSLRLRPPDVGDAMGAGAAT